MTPERAKELLPVITAFANGETVQLQLSTTGKWADDINPSFHISGLNYRIKPKPREWMIHKEQIGLLLHEQAAGCAAACIKVREVLDGE